MNLNKMWININPVIKCKRSINEVEYKEIAINEYKIIDVRSRREFSENHITGAINIPLPEIMKNIQKYVKNRNQKILVCCEYGIRSKKAAEQLEDMGYTEVYNLKGGLENI